MKDLKGYLFILGAVSFWGVSATIAKFLFTHQVDTIVLVQMRMTISTILVLIIILVKHRDLLRIEKSDLVRFAFLGILGLAGSNITYYVTIKLTNVSTAILLQYMAPLLVLGYAALTGDEELGFGKIAAGIISLAGCFLAVGGLNVSGSGGLQSINHYGLLWGIGAAICWSFTNISLRHLLKKYKVWTVLIYSFMFASIFWQFFNPPWKIYEAHYTGQQWGVFFIFAMSSIAIPHSLYFSGAQYLTPSRSIITASFEPVVAIVSAFLILGESLTPIQITGAILVISAILILQLQREKPEDAVLTIEVDNT